jgi:hypothetical protein
MQPDFDMKERELHLLHEQASATRKTISDVHHKDAEAQEAFA